MVPNAGESGAYFSDETPKASGAGGGGWRYLHCRQRSISCTLLGVFIRENKRTNQQTTLCLVASPQQKKKPLHGDQYVLLP